jgi:hypothetical protein
MEIPLLKKFYRTVVIKNNQNAIKDDNFFFKRAFVSTIV